MQCKKKRIKTNHFEWEFGNPLHRSFVVVRVLEQYAQIDVVFVVAFCQLQRLFRVIRRAQYLRMKALNIIVLFVPSALDILLTSVSADYTQIDYK